MRPLRHRSLWAGTWVAMIAATVVVCLMPPPPVPDLGIDQFDKLQHIAGYLVLGAMARALFATRVALAGAGITLVVLGIGLEIAQGQLTVTRAPDAWDAVANTLGVLLGLMATPAVRVLAWVDARIGGAPRGT